MGCFLACFGSSKNRKTQKQRYKVQPRSQRNASYNAQSTLSLEQSSLETPIKSVNEIRDDDKAKEQLGLDSGLDSGSGSGSSTRKKVTFDTNVKTYEHVLVDESTDFKTYEHVLVDESTDFELHNEEGENNGKVKEENLAKPKEAETSSETSSSSYPPNHRYQNCRESDDDVDDELEYDESDLSDEEDDIKDDVDSEQASGLVEEESERIGSLRGGGVLKPVEDLAQWRAAKSKVSTPLKLQKENLNLEQEEQPRVSSSLDRKEHSFSFSEEVSVDASLSNWLSSRETTPAKKTSTGFDACTPERNVSPRSISMKMSPEDRPILGALTLEDINKYSPSSLPRKSPSRSPDEMPIIGTVGTYWSHESTTTKNSNSVASFKGIPNTTSKYREDKKVNWYSTPFEKRLERALNDRGSEA